MGYSTVYGEREPTDGEKGRAVGNRRWYTKGRRDLKRKNKVWSEAGAKGRKGLKGQGSEERRC